MNAQIPVPSPPVNMIRLSYPIDVTGLSHLVMVLVVPEGLAAIPPGECPLTVEDVDDEPTWEDAEWL